MIIKHKISLATTLTNKQGYYPLISGDYSYQKIDFKVVGLDYVCFIFGNNTPGD